MNISSGLYNLIAKLYKELIYTAKMGAIQVDMRLMVHYVRYPTPNRYVKVKTSCKNY